ncbi:hypothetical protein [uncultured Shewanella sp.]|uniref:hypothetical protein n=1 Tax=uncultured Shewanella sp. TaxID=173975 RepID=UPI0026270498|nr:hypothetical protein [uncultured Shewanella sp.]
MKALSEDQQTLLFWLAQHNSVSVCIELCNDIGKIIRGGCRDETNEVTFQRRTLFKLKALGLIKEDIHYIAGIRYLICSISPRGIERVKQTNLLPSGGDNHA